jgi:hypothetical protein
MFPFFLRTQEMIDEETVGWLQEDSGKGAIECDKSKKEKEIITEYHHRESMSRMA